MSIELGALSDHSMLIVHLGKDVWGGTRGVIDTNPEDIAFHHNMAKHTVFMYMLCVYVYVICICILIAGNVPTGGTFQNPRSRNLGPQNKSTPIPKYTQTNTNGGSCICV